MRPLEGLVDERRYAHVQAALQPFGRWIGSAQLETGEAITPPPSGDSPPGQPVLELDDVILAPIGDLFSGSGTINSASLLFSDDSVREIDGRARVVYSGGSRSGPALVRDWLRYFQQSPKIQGGLVTYDGAPWHDLIAIDEFDAIEERAEQFDHSLIDAEMGLSGLAGWARRRCHWRSSAAPSPRRPVRIMLPYRRREWWRGEAEPRVAGSEMIERSDWGSNATPRGDQGGRLGIECQPER